MNFHVLILRYPRFAAGGSFTIAIVSVSFLLWQALADRSRPAPQRVTMEYFYDQNTGELFEVPAETTCPTHTGSGLYQGLPAGVRARVFSCGRCSDPDQRFIGWIEIPVAALEQAGVPVNSALGNQEESSSMRIRLPEDAYWVHPDSARGKAIFEAARRGCNDGGNLKYCTPPRRLASELRELKP